MYVKKQVLYKVLAFYNYDLLAAVKSTFSIVSFF